MMSRHNSTTMAEANGLNRGQVLAGRYLGVLRSTKGKAQGLWLRCGSERHAITLPKYLRPMLVRELTPDSFIQVWAYRDNGEWRAVNLLPLSAEESSALPEQATLSRAHGEEARPCIQVCGRGKCSKQGSQAIWRSLQMEAAETQSSKPIAIELVGCMKACKQGPNLRILSTGQVIHHVDQARAQAVLAEY